MRKRVGAALAVLAMAGTTAISATQVGQRKAPYWASISAGQARMRTGPGRNYPASWFYQRQDLPVRVVDVYPGWRKVRDPDGTEGWMVSSLIADQRTAMVKGGIAELHEAPNAGSKVMWRAQPGVVGRVSHCADGWCKIDVKGRGGFVTIPSLWGVDPDEKLD